MSNGTSLVCPNRDDSLECAVFHCFADDNNRKPCIGQCGHSVCLECVNMNELLPCPVCGLEEAFVVHPFNYASIALNEDCRNEFWEKWSAWSITKNPSRGFLSKFFEAVRLSCSKCVEPVKIPRICLTCDEETLFKMNRQQWSQYNIVVNKLLQRVICSNCAIDDHGEKGHEIVKPDNHKKSRKIYTMAIAHKILHVFKDAIDNKKGTIDCKMRQFRIEMLGQNLLDLFAGLEYIEEWECGYLAELVKVELIKKNTNEVDKKMLEFFGTEKSAICDCTLLFKEFAETTKSIPNYANDFFQRCARSRPHIFAYGCPKNASPFRVLVENEEDTLKEVPEDANCPSCIYRGVYRDGFYYYYDTYNPKKTDFRLANGTIIIEEFWKTELIPLDKFCIRCLDRLNYYEFLLSCQNRKEKTYEDHRFSKFFENTSCETKKSCYQNCFIKNSSVWNFVVIMGMIGYGELYKLIMETIEQSVGFMDCQLRKFRMKETVTELFNGLRAFDHWPLIDHWSITMKVDTLLECFKLQWCSFQNGTGHQQAGLRCKCTSIWKKVQKVFKMMPEKKYYDEKAERKKYEDLEITMLEMARYSITEDIQGCPMEYSHGLEWNEDTLRELNETVDLEYLRQLQLSFIEKEKQVTLENEDFQFLYESMASEDFLFFHLYRRHGQEHILDNKNYQPYTGTCGHTICLECIEKSTNKDCPVCGEEKSFESCQLNMGMIQEIEEIKRNARAMFKWSRSHEPVTQPGIPTTGYEIRLKEKNERRLLEMIGDKIEKGMECKLRRMRIQKTWSLLRNAMARRDCAGRREVSVGLASSILIENLIEDYERRTDQLFHSDGVSCECTELYDKLPAEGTYREKYCSMSGICNERFTPGCPLYFETNSELRAHLFKVIGENAAEKMSQVSFKERNCPMCYMTDFQDQAGASSVCNSNKWIEVFETFWSRKLPNLEECCLRCLFYLNNRYLGTGLPEFFKKQFKNIRNLISGGIEESKIEKVERILNDVDRFMEYFLNDDGRWPGLLHRDLIFCMLKIMAEGVSQTKFSCQLLKIRIYNLAFQIFSDLCKVWVTEDIQLDICWKFMKASSILNNLRTKFRKIKDETEKEAIRCECTKLWLRNIMMLKMIEHKSCDEKDEYRDLEEIMKKMAEFSLEDELDECPMKYNHGFVLDESTVNKLKEANGLEEETMKTIVFLS